MIQRVQTLFLTGVIICLGLSAFFPIITIQDKMEKVVVNVFATDHFSQKGTENAEAILIHSNSNIYLFIGICVAMLLTGFSLIQYKNRVLQMKLSMINMLIMATVALIGGLFTISSARELLPNPQGEVYGLASIFLILGVVLTRVAVFFIKKDEDLVRSVDRIR